MAVELAGENALLLSGPAHSAWTLNPYWLACEALVCPYVLTVEALDHADQLPGVAVDVLYHANE